MHYSSCTTSKEPMFTVTAGGEGGRMNEREGKGEKRGRRVK
jgi:hypothetical protein